MLFPFFLKPNTRQVPQADQSHHPERPSIELEGAASAEKGNQCLFPVPVLLP